MPHNSNHLPNSFILYQKYGKGQKSQELVEQSLRDLLIEIGDNDKVCISRNPPVYWPAAVKSFLVTVTFKPLACWGGLSALDETAEIVIEHLLDSGWDVLAPDTHEIFNEQIQIVARPAGKLGELPDNTSVSPIEEYFG